MAQFLRPNSDISTGSWITTPLWEKIDEVSFSDADFVECPNNSNTTFEVGLSSINPPQTGTITLRIRCRKGASGGNTRGLDYVLLENSSSIQSGTVNANLTEVYSTVDITITATITNYSLLSLQLTSTGTTGGAGGNRRTVEVSWVEIETPNKIPVVYDESISLDIQTTDTYTSNVDYNSNLTLSANTTDNYIGNLSIDKQFSLNTNVTDNYQRNVEINQQINLTANVTDQYSKYIDISAAINLNTNITDNYSPQLIYEVSINLPTQINDTYVGGRDMFFNLSLDSNVSDNYLFSKVIDESITLDVFGDISIQDSPPDVFIIKYTTTSGQLKLRSNKPLTIKYKT